MRKSGKIFGILLAVIFVVTSSASAVFDDADPTITYYGETGYMATGWKQISGKWYYFYDSGAMAYSTTIDGWTLDSSGAWIEK